MEMVHEPQVARRPAQRRHRCSPRRYGRRSDPSGGNGRCETAAFCKHTASNLVVGKLPRAQEFSPPHDNHHDADRACVVLVTITYAVKKGDTLASIAEWFTQHGYRVQYDANLQVIDSNKNLIVPGAIISISNGVMTIQSPV
jgi:hypothetical protein